MMLKRGIVWPRKEKKTGSRSVLFERMKARDARKLGTIDILS